MRGDEGPEHLINRRYRQDISMASLARHSGQMTNYHGKFVPQGDFYRVSTFRLFGIQPFQRLFWTVKPFIISSRLCHSIKSEMRALSPIGKTIVSAALMLSAASVTTAGEGPVTPYGDHCRECTIYGTVGEPIPPPEAVHALRKYYEGRGYDLGTVRHKGRFIEAEIFRNGKQVDKVIFDRRTGRVRSIY